MFGDRTPSEATETERESGRRVGAVALLLVAILGALAVALGARRRERSTLEPPF
ncbi:hypothetical protein [Haloterrigena salifodinae]|uniref:Uncharacterized protein n=1 Tax=Haloterrigena salifodinae TaxID=2675099 RepID=A0A8T8E3E1_9EURY|nr:hypothetical protein [Haloterrigena salifodinae]QRV15990.1 hypothetical protein JMJ58_03580 [Haloterrigena salifodinae]